MAADLRSTLRVLPVLSGTAPDFDPTQCPHDPTALFAEWFRAAIQADVAEPHAMTLSTVGADGHPDARVLILKDVDDAGWHFAVSSASKKGADLSSNPVAALTFYWPQLVRQVRVRGTVVPDPPDVTAADFLARSDGARALVLTRRQSQPLSATTNLDDALAVTRAELDADPNRVPDDWVSYAVRPERVEFWQGDPERRHQRVLYTAHPEGGWRTQLLWP
jgi:pyridoxamine 5'-phosphate oxidase